MTKVKTSREDLLVMREVVLEALVSLEGGPVSLERRHALMLEAERLVTAVVVILTYLELR